MKCAMLAVMVAVMASATAVSAQCGSQAVGLGNVQAGCANGQCNRSFTRVDSAPRQALVQNQTQQGGSFASSSAGNRPRLSLAMPQEQSPFAQYTSNGAYAESRAGSNAEPMAQPLTLPQVALPSDALAQSSASSGCGGGGCGGGRQGLLKRLRGNRSVSRSSSRSITRN